MNTPTSASSSKFPTASSLTAKAVNPNRHPCGGYRVLLSSAFCSRGKGRLRNTGVHEIRCHHVIKPPRRRVGACLAKHVEKLNRHPRGTLETAITAPTWKQRGEGTRVRTPPRIAIRLLDGSPRSLSLSAVERVRSLDGKAPPQSAYLTSTLKTQQHGSQARLTPRSFVPIHVYPHIHTLKGGAPWERPSSTNG